MAGEGHTYQQSTVTLGYKNHKCGILRHIQGGTRALDYNNVYNNLDIICTSKKISAMLGSLEVPGGVHTGATP